MLSSFAPWCAETCISASDSESKKPHQGFAGQNPILHQGIEWSKSTLALGLPEWSGKTASDHVVAANNGNFSWWGAFASNLFSWKNFTNEFKQGGCVGVFVDAASEGGILPDLPAGHGVEDAVTDASKMAAATYAVNQGLVVPLRSSVVRGILDLGETSASGLVLADTYAKIGAGGLAEYNAIKNGDCH